MAATMLADRPTTDDARPTDLTVLRAQQGETAAFEQLYHANVGRIYALCLRLCGDGTRAEELTQDVFVRAWEKLGSFQGKSAFSTWLHRLAVNVVLGDRRSEGVRVHRVFSTDEPEKYETPSTRASDPGTAMDLERAIAGLPPGARSVFVLHDVEGYKHEEIAEMHGSAVGTCKAQLHRARRLLREALGR
ncbi:MAG TPA: RNA polymerase sigma factor [Longimicrobium sp.]|nr:RNA polymerase sigma factor [Longimicrobium sp.]